MVTYVPLSRRLRIQLAAAYATAAVAAVLLIRWRAWFHLVEVGLWVGAATVLGVRRMVHSRRQPDA